MNSNTWKIKHLLKYTTEGEAIESGLKTGKQERKRSNQSVPKLYSRVTPPCFSRTRDSKVWLTGFSSNWIQSKITQQ